MGGWKVTAENAKVHQKGTFHWTYHPQPCWFEEGATDTEVMGGCEIMSLSHTAAENIKPKEQNLKKERSCSCSSTRAESCVRMSSGGNGGWQLASSTTHHPVKYKLHHSLCCGGGSPMNWSGGEYPSITRVLPDHPVKDQVAISPLVRWQHSWWRWQAGNQSVAAS